MGVLDRIIRAFSPTARLRAYDGWQNLTTGMGDPSRDKLTQAMFAPLIPLDYGTLESLYYGEDMCERIVDALPDECFRRGWKLEGPDKAIGEKEFKRLGLVEKLRATHGWSRLWGGAALLLGVDDGQTQDKPLNLAAVRGVKFANIVDRRYLLPLTYYDDLLSPKFGQPSTYTVTPAFGTASTGGMKGIVIHETRLIRFNGTVIDDITTRRLGGWSYSVLQRPYDVLRLFAGAFQAAGQLMNDAGQAVFSVQGLIAQLSGPNGAAIQSRFAQLDQQRWAGRMLLVDKDREAFGRQPVQVAGVADMLEHIEMRLAAAARMPVTKLMGRAPAGMDATGDNDTREWYASVKAEQSNKLEPAVSRILDVLTQGAWSQDEANKVEWSAMEEPNDKETAEVDKLEAETYQIYTTIGALSGEQVALVKFANKPLDEVIDEDALTAIVESDYKAAKDPPPALPLVGALPPQLPPPKSPPVVPPVA